MSEKFKHNLAKLTIKTGLFKRLWIVSGGQSGVDRAAMEFALMHDLPVRGWCPQGRLAEDGVIPARIPLQESKSPEPALRTELNVYDSDATLILTFDEVKDGTVLTEECAAVFKKPVLIFQIITDASKSEVVQFRNWIEKNNIKILNIAGPRESFRPGVVYAQAWSWLQALFIDEQIIDEQTKLSSSL
jgi:hypothetical protein